MPPGGASGGVRRVHVVGPEAAGKSHLARSLAAALDVPVVEVDALVRRPDGATATAEQFRDACRRALAAAPDGWVVDGDDALEVGLTYADADVVLWLDEPLRRTLPDLLGRLVRPRPGWTRAAERRALAWAVHHHASDRERWAALAARDPGRWVRLRRGAAGSWAAGLGAAPGGR